MNIRRIIKEEIDDFGWTKDALANIPYEDVLIDKKYQFQPIGPELEDLIKGCDGNTNLSTTPYVYILGKKQFTIEEVHCDMDMRLKYQYEGGIDCYQIWFMDDIHDELVDIPERCIMILPD